MNNNLTVNILTPQNSIFKDSADIVLIPGIMGDIGVLPKHSDLLTSLRSGIIIIKNQKEEKRFFISGGFAEISNNQCSILIEDAKPIETLNLAELQKKLSEIQDSSEKSNIEIIEQQIKVLMSNAYKNFM